MVTQVIQFMAEINGLQITELYLQELGTDIIVTNTILTRTLM